ncbi:hypothetical protein [Oceanobacillus sp. AG]|uniref:hypothetical protein n=1 Tax=Oceanobacillus sp. AG TaxID=2681969 RepID=UPI0012EC5BD6|nr:hypothetical protein [Oceanobacillus sp. AG]
MTRKYDMDILREIAAEDDKIHVIALADKVNEETKELADWGRRIKGIKQSKVILI